MVDTTNSPISKRADYQLPGGKRLAVYIGRNLELLALGLTWLAELATLRGPNPQMFLN